MEPLISVIVPIYEVEPYLERCVDSIIDQTYKNLEIILVDDGSPDGCGRICDQYAKMDSRVRVLHQKNAGLSAARNAGLDICKGEYISFVDSDDFVSPHFIEILYKGITFNNSDISTVSGEIIFVNGEEDSVNFAADENDCTITGAEPYEALRLILYQRWSTGATNHMCRREIFDGIRFPVGYLYEDAATTHRVFAKAKKMTMIRADIYAYRIRKDSIIRRKFTQDKLIATRVAEQVVEEVSSYDGRLRDAACSRAFAMCYYVLIQVPFSDRASLKTLWKIIRKYRGTVIRDHSPELRTKNKVGAYCTYLGMYFSLAAGKLFKKADYRRIFNK